MPFISDESSYACLLDALRENRYAWEGAQTLVACHQAISEIGGFDRETYDALVEELRSEYAGNEEQMLAQLRLAALAWPAADLGLTGPEWEGYFVTETDDGQRLYAADRFAAAREWTRLEVLAQSSAQSPALTYDEETGLLYDENNWYLPDGQTIVSPDAADPATSRDAAGNRYVRGVLARDAVGEADVPEAHFDAQTQRWQRWSDDGGVFEYYHNEDEVWERHYGTGLWYRHHSDQHGWHAYDRGSGLWLDPAQNQWRGHEQIGIVSPAAPAAVGAELDPAALALFEEFLSRAEARSSATVLQSLSPEQRRLLAWKFLADHQHTTASVGDPTAW